MTKQTKIKKRDGYSYAPQGHPWRKPYNLFTRPWNIQHSNDSGYKAKV